MEHASQRDQSRLSVDRVLAGVALAVLVAAPRIPLLLAGPDVQLSLLVDDASYYLEAARRVVESGQWPTMDGRNPTNGFHPLYMFLLIALQSVVGTDPVTVLPWVMGLQLACNGLAVWILARGAIRAGSAGAGWTAAVLLALAPGWLAHGTLGVESGISSLLLLAIVLRWETRVRAGGSAASPRQGWLVDGLLLGAAMLARTDAAIWALVLLVSTLWLEVRREADPRSLLAIAGTGLVAALVVTPWLVMSGLRFGTILQDSSAALAARYQAEYGLHASPESLSMGLVHLGFWVYRLLWVSGLVPLTGWILGGLIAPPARSTARATWTSWGAVMLCGLSLLLRANDPTDIRDPGTAIMELGLGGAAFTLGLMGGRQRCSVLRSALLMPAAATALMALAYSFVFRGFQVWYSTGPCLAFVLFALSRGLAPALQARRGLSVTIVVLMSIQTAFVVRALGSRGGVEGMHRDLLGSGRELSVRLTALSDAYPGARFGSFDSGELSYRLHPLPVSNLDGVMNHAASLALRRRELERYLAADRITHVIGDGRRIAEFQRISPFEVVRENDWSDSSGVEIWRLVGR